MPETKQIVINTGPILALIAATGNLDILKCLYDRVWIPFEVQKEISSSGIQRFGVSEFDHAHFLHKERLPVSISPILLNSLDEGEAAVIQLALNKGILTVCIDEVAGRRMARLFNLKLTGSLGILIKAKKEGNPLTILDSIKKMKERGIYVSHELENYALMLAEEIKSDQLMSDDLIKSLLE
jgi:predicted nucleic acid-binding protein